MSGGYPEDSSLRFSSYRLRSFRTALRAETMRMISSSCSLQTVWATRISTMPPTNRVFATGVRRPLCDLARPARTGQQKPTWHLRNRSEEHTSELQSHSDL